MHMRWTWVALLALVAGCDALDLDRLVRPHEVRTRQVPEPPGAHCALGGQAVQGGLDLDDDGTLDDAEVTSTEYVCATALPELLVHTQPVEEGAQCPRGGQRFRAGLDLNGNGLLEESEVTREAYGCDEPTEVVTRLGPIPSGMITNCLSFPGTLVEAGPDDNANGVLDTSERRAAVQVCTEYPERVLVRLAPEPAGARCPTGGTRVRVGSDWDDDHELDDSEVSQTTYVCQQMRSYTGDFTVFDEADLAVLQGLSHIRGNLHIQRSTAREALLPGLQVVEGDILIYGNPTLTRLEMPGLRFVGGVVFVDANTALDTLVFGDTPEVPVWMEYAFRLGDNTALRSLEGVRTVRPNSLILQGNTLLESGSLDAIEILPGLLIVRQNPLLQQLPLPRLQRVMDTVDITNNSSLRSLSLPLLELVGGAFTISENPALVDLSGMPLLEHLDRGLSVNANAQLGSLAGLESLRFVDGALSITDNPLLPTCFATSFATRVHVGAPDQVDIARNDDESPDCPTP